MSPARRRTAGASGAAALGARVVATARALNTSGLNRGTSGNVSVRTPTGFLVTPSGFPYDAMTPRDLVAMTLDGAAKGRHAPSTEWPFHAAVYRARPEAGAVVHVHSEAAMALACLRRDVPAFHYMVAVAGGRTIRCAPYATFGTETLAAHAVAALEGRKACLLANHGQLTLGPTLDAALKLAVEVESLCATYLCALTVGEPVLLSDAEMDEVLAKFATYGVRTPGAPVRRRGRVRR
ncbi:MAG: class II aldolase/adducin family protein [Planctomycetia bacterium]|nr:class II aldolase/adducin family protein [Planctomycetia bacterium]